MSHQKNRTPNRPTPLEKWEKQPNRYDLVYSIDYPAGENPRKAR